MLIYPIQEKVLAFFEQKLMQRGIELSQRERDCLLLWVNGNSMKAIGRLLEISPRTVEWHVDKVKFKCRAKNRKELMFIIILGR
jgi:DNA-binding CsgD family transcriptional regulator